MSTTPFPAGSAAQDRNWAARATALRRETPANLAMLAAILAVLTTFLAWVAVLVPGPGATRSSPLSCLLGLAASTLVLVIRSTRGLVRRRAGAGSILRRGLQVGAVGAVLLLLLVWTWPTDTTLKLAFSGSMPPMAAAAWGARRAIRGLRDTGMMEGS